MKSNDQRAAFVLLRGKGKSYRAISKELNISRTICGLWEKELIEQIIEHKAEQLRELYETYFMLKEARIKALGETLNKINTTLNERDFTEVLTEKLLDFKLKYMEALKNEYVELDNVNPLQDNFQARDILNQMADLLNRFRAGVVTPEQATREGLIIGNILKAYGDVELKDRLDALENILRER
ncbi:hypothetical protein Desor_0681 [Desulfosporosinus orientis DSM 765]|uniref:Uncharacterized protein n=1 Tax=Desulfosporosinus orientis (strain ATCC 19365 / DSM 765 / NCIMB 8382 / VKM B-1628 / Singapore I) TaxID=768706 RepID=G7W5E3_DESOD|nr:hypothetical protein [Desulfosporosinus orientis]AET66371.1 hypothetical protein Desor_0681 [Desulfosporosinus orientis DSM 765]